MKMPNFLIVGAPKSGTTSLYQYLKQHPKIYLPTKKEPHFFSFEGRTEGFNGPGQAKFMEKRVTKMEDYCALFDKVTDEIAIGEASTSYLYVTEAVARIEQYIPKVKLIAILRDPVDRAFSHYLHHRRNGGEVLLDFAQAIQEEENRIRKNWSPFWQYKRIGFYYSHLKRYFDKFPANQIRVYLYEELRANPTKMVQDIFSFLEVDDTWISETSKKYNLSSLKTVPRNKTIHEFLTQENPIKSAIKQVFPRQLRQQLKKSVQQGNIVKMSNSYKPSIDSEIRKQLIEEYREDILRLQDLIERDLSKWLEV